MDSQSIYRRRWLILSVLIVGLLAIVIDNTVLNVALKTIAEPHGGLGASQSQLEWAINSYTLVFAGLLFTFGVVGDKIGRKRMLMIGLALFGIASLLSAYAQTPEQLIFARAAMGLAGAAVILVILGVFAWYEARIAHPSLDVRLFRDRRLSASVGALALVFFGMGGVFFFTSFYLQNVRGYSPLAAGLLTVPFAAGQLVMSPRSAGLVQIGRASCRERV